MTTKAPSKAPVVTKALPTVKGIFSDLGNLFKLTPRESQVRLSELTRSTLALGGVGCYEAPTGTGKTLGYLAGALDAQAHSPAPIPIVIATATVGLQDQIIRHDIPRLAQVGAVDPKKVAVAKGRGRYFCPRTAALLEDKKSQDTQFDMFNGEKHVADGGTQVALDMLKSWREGNWDGDRDSWPGVIPACWAANCGASSDTCVNRACDHYDQCPYMHSRAKLGQAQVIIANHDMVLADLAQRSEEQKSTALPPSKYVLIFDEAHNLPEKAVSTKRAIASLADTDWLRTMGDYNDRCTAVHRIERMMVKGGVAGNVFSLNSSLLVAELDTLSNYLNSTLKFDDSGSSSWGLKSPDDKLRAMVLQVAGYALYLVEGLKLVSKGFSEYAEETTGSDKAFAVRMLSQTHKYARQSKDLYEGLSMFCTRDSVVRWVSRAEDETLSIETQPLEGREVLEEVLWKTEIPTVLVSATLQIAGSFSRFKDKCGLPARTVTEALPPVFDYTRGYLHQPHMRCDPSNPEFETEVAEKLTMLFENKVAPGMLVLFTSRQSMRRVVQMLPDRIATRVLCQDKRPLPELVAMHRATIDRGERSILVGLDSMSEGLDLPGKYLGHVIITRLPFAVPGDPVEEARREHLGKAWFEQAYLADMLTMLIQASGRLIRREEDHGVITILDKRLSTKGYAMKAMRALPGFTRGTNLKGYFDMQKERGFDPSHGMTPPSAVQSPPVPTKPKVVPLSAAAEELEKAPKVVESPLASLWRLKAEPAATGRPLKLKAENLPSELYRLMPVAPGPFPEEEPDYLGNDLLRPCLPPGAPWGLWGERQMPQAVMLGLRFMNVEWNRALPDWLQVLSIRPDLVQFAEILRAHDLKKVDVRRDLVTADACQEQLEQGFAGLDMPDFLGICEGLDMLESDVLRIMREPYLIPSREILTEMATAALRLGLALRVDDI